ncbi:MAG: IS66 family transposase [Chitinophagaceae bacterium]|nr:IS66 family transposase [Rubrivivax sp.]
MLDTQLLKAEDLQGLSSAALTTLVVQMLAHIGEQTKHIDALDKRIDSQAQGIKWRDAKIESITFQLAKLKAWRFGAKTERMNAEQREIFEETFAADQASLEAQLAALQSSTPEGTPGGRAPEDQKRRQPKREALPQHLPRVDQRIEPQDTRCPTPECGQPMVRVGEDISERLDIVPAQFFVQRQIRGKWACKCCQLLVQEPAAPQVFDNALPTPGLQAHTAISRFVDHIPYYRQEQINARSGVRTPRSTLAGWGGQTGAQLMPLYDAHRAFVLSSRIVHADETPISMLDPGAGKTKKAYMWAYVRGAFDPEPGVVFDFCLGRGGKYPSEFLKGWSGTLVVDAYGGYDGVLSLEGRSTAFCLAHARRKFDELIKTTPKASPVAAEAIQRIAWLYRIEADARELTCEERLQMRLERSKPLWDQLHLWLKLERTRVPDGGAIAKAIDYSLNRWEGFGRFLLDGDVPLDNNHCENRMRPWALGRRNWLFIGSQLAGERAAVVMSLLQSAKLNGHDPWAYLKDVLTRMPTQLNSRIEELLPHRWQPAG